MITCFASRATRIRTLSTATMALGCAWFSRDLLASDMRRHNAELFVDQTKAAEVVRVSNAYALPALKGGTGGAFMQITNTGSAPVRILRATSADANAVELHESMEHNGSTHMQPLKTLDIAPGASTALKAGGKHFMLIGLRRAFATGDTMRLVLTVQNIGAKTSAKTGPKTSAGTHDIAVAVPVRIP